MNTILAILSKLKWLADIIDSIRDYFQKRKLDKEYEARKADDDYMKKYYGDK